MSSMTRTSLPSLLDDARRAVRALGVVDPDTPDLFLGLADDLFGAWPRAATESAEATDPAARRARGSARQVPLSGAFPAWPPAPSFQQSAYVAREIGQ